MRDWIKSCQNSTNSVVEHFVGAAKTIKMPKGATKDIDDYKLTRYACYLIAKNEAHYEVGLKIINTIKELSGIMPEDFPTLKKSLKELEKENKKCLRKAKSNY